MMMWFTQFYVALFYFLAMMSVVLLLTGQSLLALIYGVLGLFTIFLVRMIQ